MSESHSGRDGHLCDLKKKKERKAMDISAFSHSPRSFSLSVLQRSLAAARHSWGLRAIFSSPPHSASSPCRITGVGAMQVKLGMSLQLQIFEQELLGVSLEVFSPLLCKQVVVLGRFALRLLPCSGRAVQAAGETGLAARACPLSLGNRGRIWG